MKYHFFSVILIIMAFNLSAQTTSTSPLNLIGSKWIHPVHDDCSITLCFTTDKNVQYSDCNDRFTVNVGYDISEGHIKIRMHGDEALSNSSQLILFEDNGILRQLPGQKNNFPAQFIRVPGGDCSP